LRIKIVSAILAVVTTITVVVTLVSPALIASVVIPYAGRVTTPSPPPSPLPTVEIGVYWDSECTSEVSSVDVGSIEVGSTESTTVYVRNEGDAAVTLLMRTENWSPPEALVQWSLSPSWGITDPDYAINTSRYVGATAVLLMIYVFELENVPLEYYVERYRKSGFDVYFSVAAEKLLTPDDVSELLKLNFTGLAVDLEKGWGEEFDETEAESSLIELAKAFRAIGKKFAYYHGDGLRYVNATKLSNEGLIVWASSEEPWEPPWGWRPGTWNLSTIWTQECIWNRDGKYSTYDSIVRWYETLPRKPEGIVWWQTTCRHKPTEEQVQAMKNVTLAFTQAE